MQTSSGSSPRDRTPVLLGGAGCGCGMLLAAVALFVLALVSAGGGDWAAVKPDPARPDITITRQDAFLQQMMARLLPAQTARDVTIQIQPGGVILAQGQVRLNLLGQQMSVPFSLAMRLSAQSGRLRVDVTEVHVGDDPTLSAAARTMLGELSDQVSQAINTQIVAGLGRDAYIMDVATDGPRLVIRARWTGP